MLKQSAEENRKASIDIERLMKTDLRDTVSTYLSKYSKTLDAKLGLSKEDLKNDIREQIWKGLLTHNPQGRANLKTYLNTLIKNRFGVLFKRSKIKKNNMVQYFAELSNCGSIEDHYMVTEETGETIFMRRQVIMEDQLNLLPQDRMIYEDLLLGRNLQEITAAHKLPRSIVIGSINRIDEVIKRRLSR